jgi:hypothetical protein
MDDQRETKVARAVVYSLLWAVEVGGRETSQRAMRLLSSAELWGNLVRQARLWMSENK